MKRKYALYYKVNGKHRRVSQGAYFKEQAVHIFQNRLLDGFQYHASLRPEKVGETIYHIVHGAYGIRYETSRAALNDWRKGIDFEIYGGPYCSNRDDIHVFIRLVDGTLVEAHGTPKEAKREVPLLH